MDIGLHQSKKNMIYQKMDPAFEDLFDTAEEHILLLLLEPWMKMVEADKYTYGKVTDLHGKKMEENHKSILICCNPDFKVRKSEVLRDVSITHSSYME